MYFTQDKITEIFYLTDEFCKEFQKSIQGHLIGNQSKKKPKMSQSEVITILIIFHAMQHKNLKILRRIKFYNEPFIILKLFFVGVFGAKNIA